MEKMKGYDKLDPKENEGQCQSSLQEFFQSQKTKVSNYGTIKRFMG